MNRKLVRVLGVLVLLSVYWTSAEGAITCTVPSVSPGGSTNVTCVFPQDIRISKSNIKVQRQPLDTKEIDLDKTENVLECHWLDQQTLNCDAKSGYKLIGQVSNRAVVGIPTATNAHEGKYTCEVVPSEPREIHPCYFYLKEKLDAAVVYERLSQLSDELLEVKHAAENDAQQQAALVSAVLAFAILCLVAIVAVALLYVCRKRLLNVLQRCAVSRSLIVDVGKTDHNHEKQLETEDTNEERDVEMKPLLKPSAEGRKDQNTDAKSLPESKSAPCSSANTGYHRPTVDNNGAKITHTAVSSPMTPVIGTRTQAAARTHETQPTSQTDVTIETAEDIVRTCTDEEKGEQTAPGQPSPPEDDKTSERTGSSQKARPVETEKRSFLKRFFSKDNKDTKEKNTDGKANE